MAMQVMSVEEAAQMLHLSTRTVYNKCSARELPHIKCGGRLLFDREDLETYLSERKVMSDAEVHMLADLKVMEAARTRLRRMA